MIHVRTPKKVIPARYWEPKFCWLPLTFIDHDDGKHCTAWLRFVSRHTVTPPRTEMEYDMLAPHMRTIPGVYVYSRHRR